MNERLPDTLDMGKTVYIVGDCFRGGAIRMFAKVGCRGAAKIEDADFVCFLGGADINPALYGEHALHLTHFSDSADSRDCAAFEKAMEHDKPMFGICRGMQFLHAMAGGKLYQHVSNHAGRAHLITDLQTKQQVMATSLHHQQCIEDEGLCIPIAYGPRGHSGIYRTAKSELSSNAVNDLEACIWPGLKAFGVQGHPELDEIPAYTSWAMHKLDDFLNDLETYTAKPIADVAFIKQSITS